MIDEREFELINILGAQLGSNQRDISRRMNLSLGMVNILVGRLIAKGLIRIEQLNKKKVQYILTPKGFSEKMSQSIKYTLNTVNSFGLIREKVKSILEELYAKGSREFFIYSEKDLSLLIEAALRDMNRSDVSYKTIFQLPADTLPGPILLGKENVPLPKGIKNDYVDLISEVSKNYQY